MSITNNVIERMKAATHTLVTMEIERSPEPIRDQEAYRRKRLPAVYAEHQQEWQEAYMADPSITVNQFISMVCGFRYEGGRIARSKMERNMEHVRELARTKPDPEVNARGLAQARAVLRGQPAGSADSAAS